MPQISNKILSTKMAESENIQAEPPGENISEATISPQAEILTNTDADSFETSANDKIQTEYMEVHKHPHHVTHKKNWGEYLLEFFMLFLAVFLGFVAENIRENSVERHREKEYIESMVEDLKTDSAFLQLSINKLIPYHTRWMDSTMHLFEIPTGKDRLIYQAFFLATAWTYNFHPTERTLTQLRSQGYHLIKNKKAATAISQLEDQYKIYSQITAFVNNMQNNIDVAAASFADRNIVDKISSTAFQNFHNDPFVHFELKDVPESATIKTGNKEALKAYIQNLNNFSFYVQSLKNEYIILLNSIDMTIGVLKKEYHIKDE